MAKRAAAVESKPASVKQEESFVELMLVAADFVQNCGGIEAAKKAPTDAGQFIERAGGTANAGKALDVLESLKGRISG